MELPLHDPSVINVIWVGMTLLCGYVIHLTGLPAVIGLKLDLKGLTRPEIWAGTTTHVLLCILFFGGVIMAGSALHTCNTIYSTDQGN